MMKWPFHQDRTHFFQSWMIFLLMLMDIYRAVWWFAIVIISVMSSASQLSCWNVFFKSPISSIRWNFSYHAMHRWIPHVVHPNMWYQCFFLHAQKYKAHLGSLQLEAEGKWGMVISN